MLIGRRHFKLSRGFLAALVLASLLATTSAAAAPRSKGIYGGAIVVGRGVDCLHDRRPIGRSPNCAQSATLDRTKLGRGVAGLLDRVNQQRRTIMTPLQLAQLESLATQMLTPSERPFRVADRRRVRPAHAHCVQRSGGPLKSNAERCPHLIALGEDILSSSGIATSAIIPATQRPGGGSRAGRALSR